MSARVTCSATRDRGAGRNTAWRRRSAGVAPAFAALLVALLALVSTPPCSAQPAPPPPPPPTAPVTIANVAACSSGAGTTLAGASTVTYTIAQFAGITPASLANGINAALAASQTVTGLETAGVTVDYGLMSMTGGTVNSGALFSSATGLPCGFVKGGVLNRTGFPADSGGAQVLLNVTSSSAGPPALGGMGMPSSSAVPAYVGTPVSLVCSSCVFWTAPPSVACGPTHRYNGSAVVASNASYPSSGGMMGGMMGGMSMLSGTVLNVTDVGSSTGPPLATQLPWTGASGMIQQACHNARCIRCAAGLTRYPCCAGL